MIYTRHPEIRKAVANEMLRLLSSNPGLSTYKAIELSEKLVRALADANTKLFFAENITINR